jgi:hypothetical protein
LTVRSPWRLAFSALPLVLAAGGCGAGQYGFSKTYAPLDEEKAYDASSTEAVYEDVTSDPAAYDGKQIAWFGVVDKVTLQDDGRYRVELSQRVHQARHLCSSDADDSCRVTVSSATSGSFTALVQLKTEDTVPGLDKVQPGSLMRVFGEVRCRLNEDERQECDHDEKGGVILDVAYYRHWPARYYVTPRQAGTMRR